MHPGGEDGAEHDPGQGRPPSPEHGDGRADNRCSTRDRGEVVPEHDVLVRGHVVDAVGEPMGRGDERRVQRVDVVGEVARVVAVAEEVEHSHYGGDVDGGHDALLRATDTRGCQCALGVADVTSVVRGHV